MYRVHWNGTWFCKTSIHFIYDSIKSARVDPYYVMETRNKISHGEVLQLSTACFSIIHQDLSSVLLSHYGKYHDAWEQRQFL